MIADVIAVGARSPLGLSSTQVTLCVRARKLEPRSVAFLDRRGQEIGIALTGGLGERLFGYHRMVSLAAPALSEALSGVPDDLAPTNEQPLPVLLCAPEKGRPDDDKRFEADIIGELAEKSGAPIDVARSTVVREGQAGFARALGLAKTLLDQRVPLVCVGGVDSYYHPGVLRWLDEGYRLHAIGADSGFIPSEAAAFLILARLPPSAPRLGRFLHAETGREASATSDEQPNLAEAMTVMLESTEAQLGRRFEWTISDYNGERHRLREWERARGRIVRSDSIDSHWVWDTGDVGAASGALFSTIALSMCDLGCAHSTSALLALHSEGGERGLVAVEGRVGETS